MKILHTADIHLREHDDERWKTLRKLIELGKKKKIKIFVISGDLFDRGVNAEKLRSKIRKMFSNNGFKIVIIPGNHDKDSFKTGLYFGDDTIILNDPLKPFELNSVRIVGLPFEQIEGEEILNKLAVMKKILTDDKSNILLCHGELLDSFFSRRDFGEEGTDRYMPFWLYYFNDLNLDYVLAGHFHTAFDIRRLENGGYFVYPGSPVSITKKEVGQRRINIFEVGKRPKEYPIDSPHFEEVDIKLSPFEKKSPAERVSMLIAGLHPEARTILKVGGYVNCKEIKMTETELKNKITEIAGKKSEEISYEFSDIQEIIENDLFKEFLNKLKKSDLEKKKKKNLIEVAIKAMIEARS